MVAAGTIPTIAHLATVKTVKAVRAHCGPRYNIRLVRTGSFVKKKKKKKGMGLDANFFLFILTPSLFLLRFPLSLSVLPPTGNANIKLQLPRCGCSFAEGLRLLSEFMPHMCGGSGPHQSRRRLGGRSLSGGLRGHGELVIRAPAGCTGPSKDEARLHSHTQIPIVSLLMQGRTGARSVSHSRGGVQDCLSVHRAN